MQHNQRDGAILIILCVTGYSCLPVIIKELLARGADPLDIAFWRFLFATLAFWLIVFARRRKNGSPARPLPRLRLMALGTLFAGQALAAFFGLERLHAGTFSVLFYSYPAMVAILEALLGERLPLLAWGAVGLTLVGVALTAPDFSAGFSGDSLPGVLLALLDAFQVAIYFLISSRMMRDHSDMVTTSALTVTGAFVVLCALSLARGMTMPQGVEWVYLLALGLISTVLPVFALNAGIQKLGATRAAIIATFEPLLTAVLALIFIGEVLLPIQWFGGAVIIASVILLQIFRPATEPMPAISD